MRGSFALIGIAISFVLAFSLEAKAGIITDFSGDFAPANWTVEQQNSNGSATFYDVFPSDSIEDTLIIIGSTSGATNPGVDGQKIVLPNSGSIKFDWFFFPDPIPGSSADTPGFDKLGYTLGNTFFLLSDEPGFGPTSSGTFILDVTAGQSFSFQVVSTNNNPIVSQALIGGFSFTPAAVPEPSTCILLGALLAGGGFTSWRMRKRKIGEGAA